jgi:NAD-dependent SIR2 family protein deacetylase
MNFFSMPSVSGRLACAERGNAKFDAGIAKLRQAVANVDAVIVGAGAGLSTAAGLTYSGERFDDNFADFRDKFSITNMYSGGFYPFPDIETF